MLRFLQIGFFGLLLTFSAQAQQEGAFLEWAHQTRGMGDLLRQRVEAMVVDDEDNIYITGRISDTVDFDFSDNNFFLWSEYDPTVISQANYTFIAKYDSDAQLLWARRFVNVLPENLRIDTASNIYISGAHYDTLDFDPGNNNSDAIFVPQGRSSYIAKYTLDGDFVWVERLASTSLGFPAVFDFDVSPKDDLIVVTGGIGRETDFDPSENVSFILGDNTNNFWHCYLAAYSLSGELLWAYDFQYDNFSGPQPNSKVILDHEGGVYFSLHFTDTLHFDPSGNIPPLIAESPGPQNPDVFTVKYSKTGEIQWYNQVLAKGSFSKVEEMKVFDQQLYLLLSVRGGKAISNNGSVSVDITHFEHTRGAVAVLSGIDGSLDYFHDIAVSGRSFSRTFDMDKDKNLYIAGMISVFDGPIVFNEEPEELITLIPGGLFSLLEFFVVKIDSSRVARWAFSANGKNESISKGVKVLSNNDFVFVGDFRDTINVAGSSETPVYLTYFPHLNPHMFFCKYRQETILPPQEPLNPGSLLLYPNPTYASHTLVIAADSSSFLQIDLYDLQGRKIREVYRGNLDENDFSIQVDVSDLASGLYMYAILLKDERKSIRFVKD